MTVIIENGYGPLRMFPKRVQEIYSDRAPIILRNAKGAPSEPGVEDGLMIVFGCPPVTHCHSNSLTVDFIQGGHKAEHSDPGFVEVLLIIFSRHW